MEQLELKLLWATLHGLKKIIAVQNKKLDNINMIIRVNSFSAKDDQFNSEQLARLKDAFTIKDIINPDSIDFEKAKDLLENMEMILTKYGDKK